MDRCAPARFGRHNRGVADPLDKSDDRLGAPQGEPPSGSPGEATELLVRMSAGESHAAEELLPLVYGQLRAFAGSYFRNQPANHTLQPTALVNEAFLKLAASTSDW